MPKVNTTSTLDDKIGLAVYMDKEAEKKGVRETLLTIQSLPAEQRRDAELALGAALETKALSYVTPEVTNIVVQFVDIGQLSPAITVTGEIARFLKKPAGKYRADCRSIIGGMVNKEDEACIEKAINEAIDAMKTGNDSRVIFEVPSWLKDRFLTACRNKGLLNEKESKGDSIVLNDPNIKVQLLEQAEGEPDVRTQFKFGIAVLERVRRDEKGKLDKDADNALLNLIAFMVGNNQNPLDVLNNLFKCLMKIRKIDWRIMDQQRESWEAVATAL